MNHIKFEKKIQEAKLLNPLSNFQVEVQPIEYRKDPLTGKWCRINLKRVERVKQNVVRGVDTLLEVVERTRKNCFFCPENLEKKTPRFPSNLVPEGRLKVGSACLFPNLYPFGEYHAIGIFSGAHYLKLNQFSPRLIRDCIKACIEYIKQVSSKHKEVRYCSINCNYLFPAGSSIVHPHVQVLADRKPTYQLDELVRESRSYYQKYGSNYWSDLVGVEKEDGSRFIGTTGNVAWLVSFAPRGRNDVLGGSSRISTIPRMDDKQVEEISTGISKVLNGYYEMRVQSFNMTFYSGSVDQDLDYFSLAVRMMSRPDPQDFYTNDAGFMERFHDEIIIESKPEEVAEKLRKYF